MRNSIQVVPWSVTGLQRKAVSCLEMVSMKGFMESMAFELSASVGGRRERFT